MKGIVNNLFACSPSSGNEEQIHTLVNSGNIRIERIVSNGQCSPNDFWYDQPEDEWVLLMKGTAVLAWEDGTMVSLKSGDFLTIPAHLKDRVFHCPLDAVWVWSGVNSPAPWGTTAVQPGRCIVSHESGRPGCPIRLDLRASAVVRPPKNSRIQRLGPH